MCIRKGDISKEKEEKKMRRNKGKQNRQK